MIPDSVQYETWEAHIKAGWVVFVGGGITLFPPAPNSDGEPASQIAVYGAAGCALSAETVTSCGIEGLRSIGIASPSHTGITFCTNMKSVLDATSHDRFAMHHFRQNVVGTGFGRLAENL